MVKKKSFGLLIRESRIKQGFGQRELAVKVGVAPSYLNDIEKETRKMLLSCPRFRVDAAVLAARP